MKFKEFCVKWYVDHIRLCKEEEASCDSFNKGWRQNYDPCPSEKFIWDEKIEAIDKSNEYLAKKGIVVIIPDSTWEEKYDALKVHICPGNEGVRFVQYYETIDGVLFVRVVEDNMSLLTQEFDLPD